MLRAAAAFGTAAQRHGGAAAVNMWRSGWPVIGERAGSTHVPRIAMPRPDECDVNITLPYNTTNTTVSYTPAFEEFAGTVSNVYTPVLVILGVLGNMLSVLVFFSRNLRSQSTSQYMIALAVSDTAFLLQLLLPWLNSMQLAPLFHQQGWCQGIVYMSYWSCSFSGWLVAAFTVERFVAVLYPLRRAAI